MASITSVKAKIQGLIDKANSATGKSDIDLTSAVDSLINGVGTGGSIGLTAFASAVGKIPQIPMGLANSSFNTNAILFTAKLQS